MEIGKDTRIDGMMNWSAGMIRICKAIHSALVCEAKFKTLQIVLEECTGFWIRS